MKVGDIVIIDGLERIGPFKIIYRVEDDQFFCRLVFSRENDHPNTGTYAYSHDMKVLTKLELLLLGLDREHQSE
jgi:hypothetical protein